MEKNPGIVKPRYSDHFLPFAMPFIMIIEVRSYMKINKMHTFPIISSVLHRFSLSLCML